MNGGGADAKYSGGAAGYPDRYINSNKPIP